MTDLTTLQFPTATAASSPAPATPASVTGVPGMAGQFAQTLGDLLAGTPSVAAPAATVAVAVPPATALPLPILGLAGPLPNGRLLAAGTLDRQPLADDGNVVPAEPAFQLLANPAWRATVATPAAPPRTPVSLRTALERAAAQLATPVAAKVARGSVAGSAPESVAEDADATLAAPDAATPDGIAAPSAPALPANAPIPLPAAVPVATPRPDPATDAELSQDTSAMVTASPVGQRRDNPTPAATPVATAADQPVVIPSTTPTASTRSLPMTTSPAEPDVATSDMRQEPTPSIKLPTPASAPSDALASRFPASRAQLAPAPASTTAPSLARAPVTPVAPDNMPPAPTAPAGVRRVLPSDHAILAALGVLPTPNRDAGSAPAVPAPVVSPMPPATSAPAMPIPTIAAPAPGSTFATPAASTVALSTGTIPSDPAATATLVPSPTATTAAVTPDAPGRADAAPVRLERGSGPVIAVSTTPQPAGQVFAAALASATTWRDRPVADRTDPTAPTPPLGFTTAVDLGSTTPVQPTGTAQRAPLDLTQDSGVQRMIDHIEVLRDDADSRDTRIRLVPDALGSVGIAVRQVGERIHVSFTAEHEATRALIADAQPRLTELAAERGVRIAGSTVATDANPGSSQSQAQGQGQPQSQSQPQSQNPSQSRPNAPQQPPRAAARAQRDTETPEDQRLA
ncbi:flagellar hook-length control protein FliK [Sphingomonas sp. PsM26]|nr:flagellar hook-length control protein FliK [Sphingomonas sp. PsM26]